MAERICLPAEEAFPRSPLKDFAEQMPPVLDTVKWAKAAVGASKASDRKITKGVRRGQSRWQCPNP